MSGPKVVRVRTRQERQAEAQAWISRVEAATRRWESKVRMAGLASAVEIAATTARATELSRLLTADHFEAIERQARAEIAFLNQDLEQRRQAEADHQALRRKRSRRLISTAGSLLTSLREAGKSLPPQTATSLERAALGHSEDAEAIEAAIAQAIEVLAECGGAESRSENATSLATQLTSATARRTLEDWLAEQPRRDEPVAATLDAELSRVEIEAGAALAAPLVDRARAIALEGSEKRRRILYDSLRLDLAAVLRDWRSCERIRDGLAALAAELAAIQGKPEATGLQQSIEDTLTLGSSNTDEMTALLQRAEGWLASHRETVATQARREAVLGGLAAIGYEVRDGMVGLWSDGGRLVLRRGNAPDIGVELTGNPATGRLQFRAVGMEDASRGWDHCRDADIELRFCDDVRRLEGLLGQQAVEIVIERATPAGTQPLRMITTEQTEREERRASKDLRRHRHQ
jgi:hypothetical protein